MDGVPRNGTVLLQYRSDGETHIETWQPASVGATKTVSPVDPRSTVTVSIQAGEQRKLAGSYTVE